ncbi:MAG: hypothetical protein IJ031_03135 [Oscillospiraceae bacterium]|nr:hypothetical protein [Oscillospiraceae bacterium]MBQ8378057.1 hypothetical protein [Oscillospiraceae bacterium]MBQ8883573.1 hypothetical protein [Oscillospiraceae bacterium]
MTDNEIIKALEECIELRFDDETEYVTVRLDTLTNALDLIKRQQAEIEKFKNLPIIGSLCPMWKAEARVETIKEFAEKLKAEYEGYDETYHQIFYSSLVKAIDKIAKEITGKEDESNGV